MDWRLLLWKAGTAAGMLFGYGTLYLQVQAVTEPRLTVQTPWWLDRQIPFWPHAVWVYMTMFAYMGLVIWLAPSRRDLSHYTVVTAAATLLACACFIFWPTGIDRPPNPGVDTHYDFVVWLDGTGNACPSLHATYTLISAVFLYRFLAGQPGSGWWRIALIMWGALILISTLLTKQHVIIDSIAGAALAGLCLIAVRRCWPGTDDRQAD